MQFEAQHVDALMALLRWRRDVRHFTNQPVSNDDLAVLQQAMSMAPSVGNSQPWRVISVEDHSLRAEIIADHQSANQSAAARYEGQQRDDYAALKLAAIDEAPLQLAVFTERDPAQGHGLGRQTMPEAVTYSTVLAIHSLWLTARALNLGVGWVSILDTKRVERILTVQPSWHLTAYLCIGHPTFTDDTPELERTGWQERTDLVWSTK